MNAPPGFQFNLPSNEVLAGKVIDADRVKHLRELGLLGWVFGNAANKPGNIAGAAILLSGAVVVGVMASKVDPTLADKAFTLFGGVITLALGYLFGRDSRN